MTEFKRVVQPIGTKLCLACVAAMITGEDLGMVLQDTQHFDPERPLRFLAFTQYLNRLGWHLGAPANVRTAIFRKRIAPAVLVVEQRQIRGIGTHAVLWDGRRVLDPFPGTEGKRLQDYQIVDWWPVTRVIERGEYATIHRGQS
jgi:hypothetical protein